MRVHARVDPNKGGQEVELEQRRAAGWRTVDRAVLDPVSETTLRECFGWGSIGSVTLRVRWPKQDPVNATGASDRIVLEVVRAGWMRRIDGFIGDRSIGVSVREAGTFLYRGSDGPMRTPASVEKLLLSMALLDRLGADHRIPTVAVGEVDGTVVLGDLWVLGHGDPSIDRGRLGVLARAIDEAGIDRIEGGVAGSTGYFARDWFAPGWKADFPGEEIALPTALTFEGNDTAEPEARAARILTRRLESRGIGVVEGPTSGVPSAGLPEIARIESPPLAEILRSQNVNSSNFYAEVLGKRLGVEHGGVPGTIAKGAAAIEAWAEEVEVVANDGSGLSYANRASAAGVARLLGVGEGEPWGRELRQSLPAPGQGTLEARLHGVRVRAKTGTLTSISALAGWVWLERSETWAEFAVLSSGMSKTEAVAIEDAIVRTLAEDARPVATG